MADLSQQDIGYLQDMTAHHEAAVTMSKEYLNTPPGQRRANISDMARAIISAQTDEIGRMKKWLAGEKPAPAQKPGMKM